VASDGSVLLDSESVRVDLVHLDPAGHQRLFSWNEATIAVASLSSDGKILFTSYDWKPPDEGQQQPLAMLRKTDGSPPQHRARRADGLGGHE